MSIRKIIALSTLSAIFFIGVCIQPSYAAGTPQITGIGQTLYTVPKIIVGKYFIMPVSITGKNLDYLVDHVDQTNPPVIMFKTAKPKWISSYPEGGEQAEVTFRVPLEDFIENPYGKLTIYDTDGSVIQTFDQEIEIYNPQTVIPDIEGLSQTFVSMTTKKSFLKTITLNGSGMEWIISNGRTQGVAQLGPAKSVAITGRNDSADVTFLFNSKKFKVHKKYYRVRIFRDGKVIARSKRIQIFNPYRLAYRSRNTQTFLNKTNNTQANKRTVGLNVQLGLGADTDEKTALYRSSLKQSGTKWVREHISYAEVMGDEGRNWTEKYDEVMAYYKKKNMRVVVMLAYGAEGSESTPPSTGDWAKFVRKVSGRYKNHVDAWEIWNEPDIDKFLSPPSAAALAPLLKVAYPIIKKNAPDSTVLNGPIGNIRTTAFVKDLYAQAGDYFDELSVHAYYCDEYVRDGNVSVLVSDFNDIANARPLNKRSGKIWITELGCSMESSSVDETVQKNHNAVATQALLATGKVRLIQLYTIINRPDQNEHEANFGLLYDDGREKQSWQWYEALPSK